VHVWRGGELEMSGCWVHHCGQGLTLTRCYEHDQVCKSIQNASELRIIDNRFEDICKHNWSCALSLGVNMTMQSAQDVDMGQDSSAIVTSSHFLRYKDLVDEADEGASPTSRVSVTFSSNTVCRCALGLVVSDAIVQVHQNTFSNMHIGALQLCDVVADLRGNRVIDCVGAAFALSAMLRKPDSQSAQAVLEGNVYRRCNVAIRMTAAHTATCVVRARSDILEDNGDGIIVLSPKCHAAFEACQITGSRRCGARVGRGARARFAHCTLLKNGRGIAVSSLSSVDVQHCRFADNVGWAVRLEDVNSPTVQESAARASSGSIVSGNVFGRVRCGNVGRKRVRIDAWEENRAHAEANIDEDDGQTVLPVLKRRRNFDREADEMADSLHAMSLDERVPSPQ
jgi:hypothetical protein